MNTTNFNINIEFNLTKVVSWGVFVGKIGYIINYIFSTFLIISVALFFYMSQTIMSLPNSILINVSAFRLDVGHEYLKVGYYRRACTYFANSKNLTWSHKCAVWVLWANLHLLSLYLLSDLCLLDLSLIIIKTVDDGVLRDPSIGNLL